MGKIILTGDRPTGKLHLDPEACSGPVDTEFMFDRFIEAL